MKQTIKHWLGITNLEDWVGKKPKEDKGRYFFAFSFLGWGDTKPDTLSERYEVLRKDFNELDKKFDALERYLQVEFYREDKETQVYDWADKNHSEGFRKTPKTYEQMKKAKETKDDDNDD